MVEGFDGVSRVLTQRPASAEVSESQAPRYVDEHAIDHDASARPQSAESAQLARHVKRIVKGSGSIGVERRGGDARPAIVRLDAEKRAARLQIEAALNASYESVVIGACARRKVIVRVDLLRPSVSIVPVEIIVGPSDVPADIKAPELCACRSRC